VRCCLESERKGDGDGDGEFEIYINKSIEKAYKVYHVLIVNEKRRGKEVI